MKTAFRAGGLNGFTFGDGISLIGNAANADWDYVRVLQDVDTIILLSGGAGFASPLDKGPITVKKNRVIPFKVELRDVNGNLITDLDIVAQPVIQVFFDSGMAPAVDVTDDALPAGQGMDGNQFEFNDLVWQYNLKTKKYTASGTYTVSIVSGDDSEYVIDPAVEAEFVIP